MGKHCLGLQGSCWCNVWGSQQCSIITHAPMGARSTVPVLAAAQQMPHQQQLRLAVPHHQCHVPWRIHLQTVTHHLGNATTPRHSIPCGSLGEGMTTACAHPRRAHADAHKQPRMCVHGTPWLSPRSGWRGGTGVLWDLPCLAAGQLWPPRSVRTCCPLVAPREDGSRAGAAPRLALLLSPPSPSDGTSSCMELRPRNDESGNTNPEHAECPHAMIS